MKAKHRSWFYCNASSLVELINIILNDQHFNKVSKQLAIQLLANLCEINKKVVKYYAEKKRTISSLGDFF